MTDTTDRDGALASLIACLDPVAFPHDDYVAALDRAEWDVPRAAEILLLGTGGSAGAGKRKLEHYFVPRKRSTPKEEGRDLEAVEITDKDKGKGKGKSIGGYKDNVDEDKGDSSGGSRAASASQWATLLKPPPAPEKPLYTRAGPVSLTTAAAVAAADIPLALPQSPLSPQFAAALYYEMMAESPSWPRNRWYLAGREVESNHQATSYALPGGGFGASVGVPYYYAARKYDAKPYTPLLAQAAKMVEDVVNAHLDSIPRYRWEYRGRWRANMCAANRYDGAQATVGWHADQMTYLGPYPTIASLSLGTPRAFRLRQTEAVEESYASSRPTRTYEVTLGHNSLCLMTPGCQERYKHTVPPQRALDTFRPGWDEEGNPIPPGEGKSFNTRINITFRFYRDGQYYINSRLTPDFHPSPAPGPYGMRSGTPICKCGIPTLLRADQKAKARSRMGNVSNGGRKTRNGIAVVEDDMAFFWQCQSPGTTGSMKGCGFFKILDMRGEGRGPCIGYDEEEDQVEVGETSESAGGEEDKGASSSSGAPDGREAEEPRVVEAGAEADEYASALETK